MKIIFAATPDISISCLEEILNSSHEIGLILTMPDKPTGRGKKFLPGPIKKFCLENNLPFASLKMGVIQHHLYLHAKLHMPCTS